MTRSSRKLPSARWPWLAACALLLLTGAGAAGQSPVATTKPVERSGTVSAPSRPLLDEVNRETQELYRTLQGSVLRVQMPAPKWVNDLAARDRDAHFDRYNLDPAVKQQLLEQQQRSSFNQAQTQQSVPPPAPAPQPVQGSTTTQPVEPTTMPQPGSPAAAGEGASQRSTVASDPDATAPQRAAVRENSPPQQQAGTPTRQNVVIVVPPPNYNHLSSSNYANNAANAEPNPAALNNDAASNGDKGSARQLDVLTGNARLQMAGRNAANAWGGNYASAPGNAFAPNNVGLLLDDRGHILVPLYVEREAVGDLPIRLAGADGDPADARYVGADQQTNLTVLRLVRPAGKPVTLAKGRLADGSLVLYISPADGSGRLGLWNGGAAGAGANRDTGVVVSIDGQVAGIARFGQFLSGSACQLIADQIIRHGSVRRATLGVIITQVEPDDPLRREQPLLGERPAVRVDQVMKGSSADQAGLKQGDLLLALAGDADACKDIPTIAAAVAARQGKTPVRVLRGGQSLEVTVDLHPK